MNPDRNRGPVNDRHCALGSAGSAVVSFSAMEPPASALALTLRPLSSKEAARDQLRAVVDDLKELQEQLAPIKLLKKELLNLRRKRETIASQVYRADRTAIAAAIRDWRSSGPPGEWVAVAIRAVRIKSGYQVSHIHIVNKDEIEEAYARACLKAGPRDDYPDIRKLNLIWDVAIRDGSGISRLKIVPSDLGRFFPSLCDSSRAMTADRILDAVQDSRRLGYFSAGRRKFIPLENGRLVQRLRGIMECTYDELARETAEEKLMGNDAYRGLVMELDQTDEELLLAEHRWGKRQEYYAALFEAEREALSNQEYLKRVLERHHCEEQPAVRKISDAYTLCFDGLPVYFRWADGGYECIASPRKDRPFRIAKAFIEEEAEFRAERFAGLGMCDFCTADGIPLTGAARDIASRVFNLARNGIDFFPRQPVDRILETKAREEARSGSEYQIQPRTWGQEYLQNHKPLKVIPGALFADDSQWLVYVFPNCIIAEANTSGHATYIGTQEALFAFQTMSRSQILSQRPAGFKRPLRHPGEDEIARQAWRAEIDSELLSQKAKSAD